MSDQWTDRLSEYLDDELAPDERAALEAHLRQCAACGAVLADLKRIVTRARGLEDRLPDRDLWPGIAARIGATSGETPAIDLGAGRMRRWWSFSLPQLIAAGIALAAMSGGAAWLLHPSGSLPALMPRPPITAAKNFLFTLRDAVYVAIRCRTCCGALDHSRL